MKFVKGDTIAGIIIVLINIIGGLCVGCIMNQMPIADAVSKYTILTIGDGLASQLPSLFNVNCGRCIYDAFFCCKFIRYRCYSTN